MAYSQNNEEEIILAELARMKVETGTFLDIGAWDGKGFSNTYRLAELGWKGVCVEPSPYVFPKLLENHAPHGDRITCVNAAVSAIKSAVIPWYDSGGDAISTTNPEHKKKWENGWKVTYKTFWIYIMPVQQLFDTFGFSYEMINIDVEATNIEIFRFLPWRALAQHTKIICVEHDCYLNEMTQIAAPYGYNPLAINGENLILTKQLA
jgi:FkbM family methyltransferase